MQSGRRKSLFDVLLAEDVRGGRLEGGDVGVGVGGGVGGEALHIGMRAS